MTQISPNFFQKLFQRLTNALGTLLLILLIYILQHVLDMDFVCSCISGTIAVGVLYMLIPPMILTGVVTTIEAFRESRLIFRRQRLCQTNVFCLMLKLVINYASLSAVWIGCVLIDGDWFFCLKTNQNSSQTGIPCKDKLSYEENLIKSAYKSESLKWGFVVICVVIVLWLIFELIYGLKKVERKCLMLLEKWNQPYYEVIYEDILALQVHIHLEKELKEIASKRAEEICAPSLSAISCHHQPLSGDGSDSVENDMQKIWRLVSASDFYLSKPERPSDSQAGGPSGSQAGGPSGSQAGGPSGPQAGGPSGPQAGGPSGSQAGGPSGSQPGFTTWAQEPSPLPGRNRVLLLRAEHEATELQPLNKEMEVATRM